MAQSSSTGIKDFVKHALTSYYKNFQIKLADNAAATDTNPAIKINNGKIFVYNIGGYTGLPGHDINDSSTILEVINSATNNVNDINSEIIDINERIASIPGASKMIAGNNDLTILIGEDGSTYFYVEGYTYNPTNKSITIGYNNGGHILTNGNGAFAGGCVNSNSSIESKKAGTFAYGVAYDGGSMIANGEGAIAAGFVLGTNSVINASANGSFIFGVASNGGTITTNTPGIFINGYVNGGTFDVTGEGAYTEGYVEGITKVEGMGAHAEGYTSTGLKRVKGHGAHAEGYATNEGMDASGVGAHAEGYNTHALNTAAHAEGFATTASGIDSHAEGSNTIAQNYAEHAEGKYNQSHEEKTIHSIGIGTSDSIRKNAFEVMQDGSVYLIGVGLYDGSNYLDASTLQEVINSKGGGGPETDTKDTAGTTTVSATKMFLIGAATTGGTPVTHVNEKVYIGTDNCLYSNNTIVSINGHTHSEYASSSHDHGNLTNTGKLTNNPTAISTACSLPIVLGTNTGGDNVYMLCNSTIQFETGINNLYLCKNGTWQTVSGGTDEKLSVTSTTSKAYLAGMPLATTVSTGYTNTDVYMQNGHIEALAFYQTSDARKKNVKRELDLEKCYELIDKCSEIVFEWKDKENGKEEIGMIALEVQEFFPEIINEDEDGYLSLDYSKLTVICLRVLKDLINEVKILKNLK